MQWSWGVRSRIWEGRWLSSRLFQSPLEVWAQADPLARGPSKGEKRDNGGLEVELDNYLRGRFRDGE
jgi:hypothetical protein